MAGRLLKVDGLQLSHDGKIRLLSSERWITGLGEHMFVFVKIGGSCGDLIKVIPLTFKPRLKAKTWVRPDSTKVMKKTDAVNTTKVPLEDFQENLLETSANQFVKNPSLKDS